MRPIKMNILELLIPLIIRQMQIKTTMRYHLTCFWSEWLSSKSLQKINAREGVGKRNPLILLVKM